jgi:hypothetical protein
VIATTAPAIGAFVVPSTTTPLMAAVGCCCGLGVAGTCGGAASSEARSTYRNAGRPVGAGAPDR